MKKVAVIVMLLSMMVLPCYADWNEEADNGDLFHKAPAMMGRGAVNVVTSPGYFAEEWINGSRQENWLKGLWDGAITGLGKTIAAGAAGAWDVATAVVPEYRGAGYQRGMWPNYKWTA